MKFFKIGKTRSILFFLPIERREKFNVGNENLSGIDGT